MFVSFSDTDVKVRSFFYCGSFRLFLSGCSIYILLVKVFVRRRVSTLFFSKKGIYPFDEIFKFYKCLFATIGCCLHPSLFFFLFRIGKYIPLNEWKHNCLYADKNWELSSD